MPPDFTKTIPLQTTLMSQNGGEFPHYRGSSPINLSKISTGLLVIPVLFALYFYPLFAVRFPHFSTELFAQAA